MKGEIIMEENKIKEQNRKAVAKYAKKTQSFALKYFATDIQEGLRLKHYIESNGISCNSYLKELVKRDLDNKGVEYADSMDNVDI
mgnify:FL=1